MQDLNKVIKEMSYLDLVSLQYQIDNVIRQRRIHNVLKALVEERKKHTVSSRVQYLEERLIKNIRHHLNPMIDEVLDDLEILLDAVI